MNDGNSGPAGLQPGSSAAQPELPESQPAQPGSPAVGPDLPDYPQVPDNYETLPVSSFREIWGYVMSGREHELNADYPLSDIAYFGAEIDNYGQLSEIQDPAKIAFFPGRKHMVVTCGSRALTHFVLEPESRTRKQVIADLLKASERYDGLQIDFEYILLRDGDVFRSFLKELREGLGEKMFSIALPARTRTLADDVNDYKKILPMVDRILIMAYDEHWSTSAPGPIASMSWCRSVAAYALQTIGSEKLIMGLPFYGRTWGSLSPNRAFIHSGIERIKREQGISEIRRENGIPTFTYEVPLTVTAYYEDEYSLSSRLSMYRNMGVKAAGFWRVGQETPLVWGLLQIEDH
jgi:spore germination protein YaaH